VYLQEKSIVSSNERLIYFLRCIITEKVQRPNDEKTIVSNYFLYLCLFSSIISIIFGFVFWLPILTKWGDVEFFLSFFESYGPIYTTIVTSLVFTLNNPTIQSISLVVAIGIAVLYALTKIRDQGYLITELDGIEAKYFASFLLILAVTLIFFLPFLYFLIIKGRYFEFAVDLFVLLFNGIIGLALLKNYTKLIFNHTTVSEFKSSLKNVNLFESGKTFLTYFGLALRNQIANFMICLMIFSLFYCFIIQFSLISIMYIELSLFIEFFIFCSVTRIPDGPVNIFLKGSNTIFNDAYISEESNKGYVMIALRNNSTIKIMSSSILYLEPTEFEDKDN
jgi:hypothetical protein